LQSLALVASGPRRHRPRRSARVSARTTYVAMLEEGLEVAPLGQAERRRVSGEAAGSERVKRVDPALQMLRVAEGPFLCDAGEVRSEQAT
jgi:hypothetical protein